ncbi:hypothetical protein FQZ97_865520 [compost metagenome]
MHPGVEGIVHEQVHQEGTDHAALRGAAFAWNTNAVCFERRNQPPLDVQQNPVFLDVGTHRFHQQLMIDVIEGCLDIKLHHPVVSPAALTRDRHRLLRRSSRPVSVRVRMEDRVQLRLDEKLDHGLRDTVTDRGHSQLARASRCLGNLYLLDRRREVRPRRHPIPQLVEILRQVPLEIGDGFIVDASSTAVGPDLLVGLPYRALRNVIRFRRVHAAHPRRLAALVGRITPPLRSTSITEASSLLREAPPLVPAFGILPHGVGHLSFSFASGTRFSRSVPKPV